MRKGALLIATAVLMILSSGSVLADTGQVVRPLAVGDEVVYTTDEGIEGPVTVTNRLMLKANALEDCEALVLASFAEDSAVGPEAVVFRWVNRGFVWRLQLASTTGLLPVSYAPKTDEQGTAYIEADPNQVSQAVPRLGHVYEAVLSYSPADGMLSVSLLDVTQDVEVYSTYFQASSSSKALYPVAGAVRSKDSDADVVDIERMDTGRLYVKQGLPLDIKAGLRWSLVERTTIDGRINYPFSPRPATNAEYSYFDDRGLGVYLGFPEVDLEGQLQLYLVQDDVSRLLETFVFEPGMQKTLLLQHVLPPGDSVLSLRYVDGDHTAVYGELPVRLSTGRLVARVEAEDRRATEGGLSGRIAYEFDLDLDKVLGDDVLADSFRRSTLGLAVRPLECDSPPEMTIMSETISPLEHRQGEILFSVDAVAAAAVDEDFEIVPVFEVPKGITEEVNIFVTEVSPKVFWASEPLSPGETALLRGDNFEEIGVLDHIELVRLDDGDPGNPRFVPQTDPLGTGVDEAAEGRAVRFDWPLDVVVAEPIQPGQQSVKFVLPEVLERGIYAARIVGEYGVAGPDVVFNEPQLWWSQGDQGLTAASGGWMRLFGNNLATDVARTSVALEPVDSIGTLIELEAEIVDESSVRLAISPDLVAGEYLVYVHNGYGGELGWSMPLRVTVSEADGARTTLFNAKEFGALGDGKHDDGDAIRAALEAAGQAGGGTVYLPRGAYRVSGAFEIPRQTSLKGEARESVSLFWTDFDEGTQPPLTMIKGTSQFSIEDLTIYCVRYKNVISGSTGDILINNVTIRAEIMKGLLGADQKASRINEPLDYVLQLSGNNIKVLDTDVRSSGNGMAIRDVSGVIISGCTIRGGAHLSNARHVIFEDNTILGWCVAPQWGITGLYMSRNTFQDIYEQHREAMTTDGGGGSTHRTVLGAGADWVSVEGDAGLTQLPAALVLSGKGAGQIRTVARFDQGRHIMSEPWDVQPDATSVISFTALRNHMIFMDNHMIDTGHFQFYGTAIEAMVKRNTATRSGGFWLRGQSTGGVCIQPAWYVQYLENEIIEGYYYHWDGDDHWSGPALLGALVRISPDNGDVLAVIGAVFRDNIVHNNGTIRTSTGSHRTAVIEDVIIEHNSLRDTSVGVELGGAIKRVIVRGNSFDDVDTEIQRPTNPSNQWDVVVLQQP